MVTDSSHNTYTLIAHPGAGRNSVRQSAIALFKAVVGTGVFALPPVMRLCGWVLGSAIVIFMAAVSLYSASCLVACVRELRKRGVGAENSGRVEYQEVTRLAFPRADTPVVLLCAFGQFGQIMSFVAFVIDTITPLASWLHKWHVCVGMLVIVAPITLLRDTTHPAFQGAMVRPPPDYSTLQPTLRLTALLSHRTS